MTYSGSHMIDRVIKLIGRDVEAVSAVARSVSYREPLEDTALAWLRFDDGTLASLVQHKSNVSHRHGSWETRLFGERGTMCIVSGEGVRVSGIDGDDDVPSGPDRRFEGALAELAQSIREGREPSPSGREGLRVRACLDAFYRSAASGEWEGTN